MKKILFIIPDRHYAFHQFIIESVKAFIANGYRLDILISNANVVEYDYTHPQLNRYYFRYPLVSENRFLHVKYIRTLFSLFSIIILPMHLLFTIFFKTLKISNNNYDLIIGEAQQGLIIASIFGRFFKIPYISYNDELYLWQKLKGFNFFAFCTNRLFKYLECKANRNALFTVTQDTTRARILAKINRINTDKIKCLPNSTSGFASIKKSHFLHDLFNIPYHKKIILWYGGLMDHFCLIKELITNSDLMPCDAVLVFHTPLSNSFFKDLKLNSHDRVFISDKFIPYDLLPELVSSASIGLAFYNLNRGGLNHKWIGFSSGKINIYLKHGVPCITSNFYGLKWVGKNNAGIGTSHNIHQIFSAIGQILSNYEYYQMSAINTFNKFLNFDIALGAILEKVNSLELQKGE